MIKKPIEKLTPAQRKVRRALKRKNGPSGLRRKARRLHLQPQPTQPIEDPAAAAAASGEKTHGEA